MTSSSLIVDCAPNLDFAELDPDRFARVEVGGGDRVADEGAAEGGGEVEDEPLEVFLGALSALPKTNALIAFSISAGFLGRLCAVSDRLKRRDFRKHTCLGQSSASIYSLQHW